MLQPPEAKPVYAPRKIQPAPADDIERVLNGLANMNLGARTVLGDRQNIDKAVQKAKADVTQSSESDQFIVISSDSEGGQVAPPHYQKTPKAVKFNMLTRQALDATDNKALAEVVEDFVAALKSYSSRTLTKEAFAFLDALYKQLSDPSVFDVTPLR